MHESADCFATMKAWKIFLFFFILSQSSTLEEDTVAADISRHQLKRLEEMLTAKECEDLLSLLSSPEENIFQHIDRLSPENNQLDVRLRAKRHVFSSAADGETQCHTALTDWLLKYGEKTYYDRLSRALQHIGRTDIAIEVGKNINQDKTLSLKRYVEDYHTYVNSLNLQSENTDSKKRQRERRIEKLKLRDLTWRDLDLIVERAPVPLYPKGPWDVAGPLFYGVLLGFGGTLLACVFLFLLIAHLPQREQQCSRPSGRKLGDREMGDEASGM
ncbi:transmembrane and death domain protein 1 isoform X2 [Nothobranchius furzeri]|uniref:Transcript variant X2 n=1 Tax=Nothobranchius furzeri TaxID=105023 RepID=A0A9D2XWF0_NOTFU|nr:transmembrane and death domain protein 1 isoform X1 [Nothobranchius furzeri]KAF7209173.1 transcript variant X2 [Nothobranchius furzeri]